MFVPHTNKFTFEGSYDRYGANRGVSSEYRDTLALTHKIGGVEEFPANVTDMYILRFKPKEPAEIVIGYGADMKAGGVCTYGPPCTQNGLTAAPAGKCGIPEYLPATREGVGMDNPVIFHLVDGREIPFAAFDKEKMAWELL